VCLEGYWCAFEAAGACKLHVTLSRPAMHTRRNLRLCNSAGDIVAQLDLGQGWGLPLKLRLVRGDADHSDGINSQFCDFPRFLLPLLD